MKIKYKKIGILGGTFDPPHKGHLNVAKIGIKKLKLDKLLWIITKKNPLKKKPYLNIKKRIKLSKKITKGLKKVSVNYLEKKIKNNNSFSLLKYIKKKYSKDEIYFLIGSDNLLKFHKWNNWKKIPKLAKMVIFPRDTYPVYLKSFIKRKKLDKDEWLYLNVKKINISSSLIRKFW